MDAPAAASGSPLAIYAGRDIVVDTSTSFVFIGRLAREDGEYLVLEDVDVHDRSEGQSTNEVYVMDARKYGIKRNRTRANVNKGIVVSVSGLDEVLVY